MGGLRSGRGPPPRGRPAQQRTRDGDGGVAEEEHPGTGQTEVDRALRGDVCKGEQHRGAAEGSAHEERRSQGEVLEPGGPAEQHDGAGRQGQEVAA